MEGSDVEYSFVSLQCVCSVDKLYVFANPKVSSLQEAAAQEFRGPLMHSSRRHQRSLSAEN